MGTTKLIIRNNTLNKEGKTVIFIQYCYKSKTTLFSTGEKIAPEYWNNKEQKVKKTFRGFNSLNAVIHKCKEDIDNIVREAVFNNVSPEIEYIKHVLAQSKVKHKNLQQNFKALLEIYDDFVQSSSYTKKKNTIKVYISVKNQLLKFEKYTNSKLSFKCMNMEFYDKFVEFLFVELKFKNNSVGRSIKTLKTFLNYAFEKGDNEYSFFRKFKVFNEEVDNVYLTEKELLLIYNLDLTGNQRLAKVRDLFCLSCFTGLRYSDVSRLKGENIKETYILLKTIKTNSVTSIPITSYSRSILSKYLHNDKYYLPVISNQKMNKYLKELGQLAGINDKVFISSNSGAKRSEEMFEKWEVITSHTARRTFVTLSLEKGMRPEVVMQITGHKDLKTFQRYIKIIDVVKTEEMFRVWNN